MHTHISRFIGHIQVNSIVVLVVIIYSVVMNISVLSVVDSFTQRKAFCFECCRCLDSCPVSLTCSHLYRPRMSGSISC